MENSLQPRVSLDTIYRISEDVVAREIESELIIVPLAASTGETDAELFTLNETGRAVWNRMDGRRSLRAIAQVLSAEYEADIDQIAQDVMGLVAELVRRKMLVELGSVPSD